MSGLLINNGYNYGSGAAGPNVGAGCNYAQLGAYNLGFRGIRPPVPLTSVSGYYVVPAYSAPGYDTLTHGPPGGGCCGSGSGGNYFNIGRAYGQSAGSGSGFCNTKYMGSICQ
jgi:hypothetical protein